MTSVSPVESSTLAESAAGRPAPWSQEAEQSVLGAMMLDNDAALKGAQLLQVASFYQEAHRRVFGAMVALLERSQVVDPVVLQEELRKRGDLEAAGGLEYLALLNDSVPTSANVEYHCRIVKGKALLRTLIEVGTGIVRSAYEARQEVGDLIDEAEHRIFEVSQQRGTQEAVRIKELMWETVERIEARHRGDEKAHGVKSGFIDLDKMTDGFQKSDLVVVAARPSMGKTAFCLNVAAHAAVYNKLPVVIFSLEMSREQLVERLLASEALIDLGRLRTGKLRDEDFPKLSRAAGQIGSAAIWIDDTPAMNLLELRSKARRLKSEHDVALFVIDYLQLLNAPRESENRQAEISFISRSLKSLARELRTPVVTLSQLSRGPEQRGGDRRPMLSDLRDSGAIEQDADVVLFIYRPEKYPDIIEKSPEKKGIAEVHVAKHRNGPTGTVTLTFHESFTRFDNHERREAEDFGGT
ncbi:MAG: replicative DNA helicase [Gemmatimonadetes bacterium]|nr:replicative DNA helicase [Gemmatimonadota bacterium]